MMNFPEIVRSNQTLGDAKKIQALFQNLKWTDGLCVLTKQECANKIWTSRGYVDVLTISDEDVTIFGKECKGAIVCVKYDASQTNVPLWNVVSGQYNNSITAAYCGNNRLVSMRHRNYPRMERQLMMRTGDVIEIPRDQFRSWVTEDLVSPMGECFVAVMVDVYRRVLIPKSLGGPVYHFPEFVKPDLFEMCVHDLPGKQEEVVVFGKRCTPHRKTCAVSKVAGMKYKYSGVTKISESWPVWMAELGLVVDKWASGTNFVLCQMYPDGKSIIGWHADDERDLLPGFPIVSISLGASRTFKMRPLKCNGNGVSMEVRLNNRDVLVMAGETQKNWMHCISREAKCNSPRVCLTFRCVLET